MNDLKNPLDQNSKTMTKKILILTSNPKGTDQLRLNQEIRDIKEKLRNSSQGNHFVVNDELAVRIDDLQPTILREKPRYVHFSGHGTGTQGLVIETTVGESQLVNTSALANLFKQFSQQIECVILNACYSKAQAKEIYQHINYVIGTTRAIEDAAAINFSKGFYGALGEGKSIEEAYQLGCNRIELGMNVTKHPERKLVPVESEQEFKYLDRSNNLVLTLLKKEPLNQIVDNNIDRENLEQSKMNKRNIRIEHGNYNENIEGDYTDNSRSVNISGGTVNASGAGAFSLGDHYSTVANTINQLPNFKNEPDKKKLKELLKQLQTSVLEAKLDAEDREDTLEQIKAIAEALPNSQDSATKKTAKQAMKIIRGTAAALPPSAAMVSICNQLPDLISKIF